MNRVDKAQAYFCNNFNCSQAVFATYATELGLEEELALKIATQFGGGARKGELCGAVSGALMVLGLRYGHSHANENLEKARAYQIAEDFMDRFLKEHDTVVCRELLGYDLTKKEELDKIKELGLFTTICPKVIEDVTLLLEKMIQGLEQQ